ncbi:MAG: T9SS type A sorting domain-containing protein [Bacteroidota bacterium]
MADIKEDWNPVLQNIERPKPGIHSERKKLQDIKDSLRIVYPKKEKNSNTLEGRQTVNQPYLGSNFVGNVYNYGSPNDNDIAVSNGNQLISVMNSSVFRYNLNTNTALGVVSLDAFSSTLNNPHDKYDPKALYDPVEDRFVVVFLNGTVDTATSITVAFSQTNDPGGAWNLYELPGNPYNNGLWSDYPMLAITNKELFITVNLLNPGQSWQTGFIESIVWQINKKSGYDGLALNSVSHNGIQLNGRPVRNLCPVKGGVDIYGPDMYFLSNRNLDPTNDTVFLVHITDTIGSSTQMVTVSPLISGTDYFVPPQVSQPGPGVQLLETNDSRILGAFMENDKIQFVNNCLDTATGNAAVYHGIINNVSSSPSVSASIISDPLLEIGYPNISYIGMGTSDNTSIINFNHASGTVFPGVSAVTSDGNGDYSSFVTIKSGINYLSVISGIERWGDYSGSQRKYNQQGVVWVNGMYGNSGKKNNTWIAELSLNSLAGISAPSNTSAGDHLLLYPNPMADVMNVSIVLEKTDYLQFELVDITGKQIKILLKDKVKEGKNNFSFSTAPLSRGVYFLKVSSGSREIISQKLIKE